MIIWIFNGSILRGSAHARQRQNEKKYNIYIMAALNKSRNRNNRNNRNNKSRNRNGSRRNSRANRNKPNTTFWIEVDGKMLDPRPLQIEAFNNFLGFYDGTARTFKIHVSDGSYYNIRENNNGQSDRWFEIQDRSGSKQWRKINRDISSSQRIFIESDDGTPLKARPLQIEAYNKFNEQYRMNPTGGLSLKIPVSDGSYYMMKESGSGQSERWFEIQDRSGSKQWRKFIS